MVLLLLMQMQAAAQQRAVVSAVAAWTAPLGLEHAAARQAALALVQQRRRCHLGRQSLAVGLQPLPLTLLRHPRRTAMVMEARLSLLG